MTEYNTSAWPETVGMDDALILARLIHMDLTVASMSAFNYWWSWGSGNGFLVQINGTTVTVPKRTSALGQFSRFIRPGWRRVTTTTNPTNNVYLSAYKNAAGNQVAVVVINTATTSVSLPIVIDIGQFGALTHYRTSSADSLSNVGTLPAGATVNATIVGLSVNTFVGALTP